MPAANHLKKYDVIVIGAGMGGLSAAAFLAKEGLKVLVAEQHDKPGGFISSFNRKSYRFDLGLEGFTELDKKETIGMFLTYWKASVKTTVRQERIRVFTGGSEYNFNSATLEQDFLDQFPDSGKEIKKFFKLNARIMADMTRGGAPEDPDDMSIPEKIIFGLQAIIFRPYFMKYRKRNAYDVLDSSISDKNLRNAIIAKGMCDMSYVGFSYRWESVRKNKVLYPKEGMQAIPDAIVKSIEKNNGRIMLNTEVAKILIKDGTVSGVRLSDGTKIQSQYVISNSSVHSTVSKLAPRALELNPIRESIRDRKVFPGFMMNFMGIRDDYNFKGANFIAIIDENTMNMSPDDYTPYNCPIWLIVSNKPKRQKGRSVVAAAHLPYDFCRRWKSGYKGTRGSEYRSLKKRTCEIITDRICRELGDDFRESIEFCIPSTPLTCERYTQSYKGSFMGWDMKVGEYGKFVPQRTPVKNLYLVGQWVFPGPGVAGVMAGGYYAAKKILKEEGIDLERKFAEFFIK